MSESCERCAGPIPRKSVQRAIWNKRPIPRFCSHECHYPPKETKAQKREADAAMSFRDIARALGVSHATVQDDFRKALAKLRAAHELLETG